MSPSPRYTAIVKHLVQCPPEIVHEIIGDLSIAKILDILSVHNNAYLDQCVSSHLVLGVIFPAQVLAEAKEYFVVYARLAAMAQHRRRGVREPIMEHLLSFDGVQFQNANQDILQILREPVLERMTAYHSFLPVLQHYSPKPIPDSESWKILDSAANIGELFRNLEETENVINTKKANQLERMASLAKRYPGMLRVRSDSSQEVRENSQHLARNLMAWKRGMHHSRIVSFRLVAASIFAVPDLYLVPHNRLLRAFLKVLNIHPPSKAPSHLKARFQRDDGLTTHDYPPEMEVVLEGIEYIFPRDVETEQVQPEARTEYTLFSKTKKRKAYGYNQPIFLSSSVEDKKWKYPVASYIPAADKELDWLENFLQICEYMGSMQLEMKIGQTVAAFWAIYT